MFSFFKNLLSFHSGKTKDDQTMNNFVELSEKSTSLIVDEIPDKIKLENIGDPDLSGTGLLIQEIKIYLENHLTIHGFTRSRLHELTYNNFVTIHNHEWRLLAKWKGTYLTDFMTRYQVEIIIE